MNELQEWEKVFITPDSDDWNPHCKSFAKNENAITNFEGDIGQDNRNTYYVL